MTDRGELNVLKHRLKSFVENNPDLPEPLSTAMQRVVLAIDCVLANPQAREVTEKWLREELEKFDAARR